MCVGPKSVTNGTSNAAANDPGSAVGGDHQPAAVHAGLGQADGNLFFGQAHHARMIGQSDNVVSDVALGRTAADEHGQLLLAGDAARQCLRSARRAIRW